LQAINGKEGKTPVSVKIRRLATPWQYQANQNAMDGGMDAAGSTLTQTPWMAFGLAAQAKAWLSRLSQLKSFS
jgi:hypothetical protein